MPFELPQNALDAKNWTWDNYKPLYEELESRPLSADTVDEWMHDWNAVDNLLGEVFSRSRVAITQDTSDEEAEAFFKNMMATMYQPVSDMGNRLNKKLVESGFTPANFELPLKKLKSEIALYREENIPLTIRQQALSMEYSKTVGAHSVVWEGKEVTLEELKLVFENPDRPTREKAWRLMMNRWLQDRDTLNGLWEHLYDTRQEAAKNAGYDNYLAFRWEEFKRFDYTPADTTTFHNAIEQVVVPAAIRANERRQARLGVDSIRPWDLDVDPYGEKLLRPWQTIDEFSQKAISVFKHVDPVIGDYYATLHNENLTDLQNRKNKGPGAYCTSYPHMRRPFIFMNAVGKRDDVRTLLHEAGHAFHNFETMANLPYNDQRAYPIEFAEVASMAMELLASPYLTHEFGGYFDEKDAAIDRISHLEKILFFWPYMAVVDSFQQWAYTNPEGRDPKACDQKWAELWSRFIKVDYEGLEDIRATGWHRKQHIFNYPMYYVEYGLAQLGAVQVWGNALTNQEKAVADYRKALALGGTRSLPELYGTAGVKFAFDAETLGNAVALIEKTVNELETV
ncbi:MAG: M3 family oligoendopeptidase [Phototrophicales bacterium]|nr:M3 family oligoendopeptidase [Phototrophicales bacterium]